MINFFKELFKPAKKSRPKPFTSRWYAMPLKTYEEYDKDHLLDYASVITKNIYGISENRTMEIMFDNSIKIYDGDPENHADCEDLELVKDKRVIDNLNRKFARYIAREHRDYRRLILADDLGAENE